MSNYFSKIGAGAGVLEDELAAGEIIHIKGHTTDVAKKIKSLQIENKNIENCNRFFKGDFFEEKRYF